LVAVIAVTAVVSISIASGGDSSPDAPSAGGDSEFASADDTGPVNIITEDPTCAAWTPINNTLVDVQRKGWNARDPKIPVKAWTPEQRAQYEEVGTAMQVAADQTVILAELTPHRIMRELYEIFISYAREYADTIPSYSPADNHIAGVVVTSSSAIAFICAAIEYGSAAARAPLIDPAAMPSLVAPPADQDNPKLFLEAVDPICTEWHRSLEVFIEDTAAWQDLNPNSSAGAWTTEERAIVEDVIPVMNAFAQKAEDIGLSSRNPIFRDLATLVAQYRRAYAAALPTYTPADFYLARVSARAASLLYEACEAAA